MSFGAAWAKKPAFAAWFLSVAPEQGAERAPDYKFVIASWPGDLCVIRNQVLPRPFAPWAWEAAHVAVSDQNHFAGATTILGLAIILALAPTTEIAAFGSGARTCESAFAADNYPVSYAWVMGYFSGLNTASAAKVGHTADGDAIMAEVQLFCRREPAARLIEAAERTFAAMQEAGR